MRGDTSETGREQLAVDVMETLEADEADDEMFHVGFIAGRESLRRDVQNVMNGYLWAARERADGAAYDEWNELYRLLERAVGE